MKLRSVRVCDFPNHARSQGRTEEVGGAVTPMSIEGSAATSFSEGSKQFLRL